MFPMIARKENKTHLLYNSRQLGKQLIETSCKKIKILFEKHHDVKEVVYLFCFLTLCIQLW